MKYGFNEYCYLILITAIILVTSGEVKATPPPTGSTDETWSHPFDSNAPIRPEVIRNRNPRRDLDNYFGRFQMKCRFIDSMQEKDPEDQNFGGLHEGEGDELWRIVETDNTQESIRVWCEHAAWFDDRVTFAESVEAAWVYANNNPAWEESAAGEMYGLHNSGWGLVAEMKYRMAYNSESQREYGANCANLIIEHTPEITVDNQDILMPLIAGWASGTLYLYGEFEDNDTYRDAAVHIGSQVKNWIDADSTRLYANEVWALCGGTAMWGVLNTLGRSDSANTANWAENMITNMDVFAGRGTWNNSWNIWYAHAWIAAWKLTGNRDYLANAETIVDSLLAQDGDSDGGIPATGGDGDDADQSWVSAYTAWMGLTNLFDILPDVNCAVTGIIDPAYHLPLPEDEPIMFSFTLSNGGYQEVVNAGFSLQGAFNKDSLLTLNGWLPLELHLPQSWTPEEPGEYDFRAIIDAENDADRSDDTLSFTLNIQPRGLVEIECLTEENTGVECRIDFYNLNIDDDVIYRSASTDPNSGMLQLNLMIGDYRVEVTPEFPFAKEIIDNYPITSDEVNPLNLTFVQPSVLLVNNDISTSYIHYYENALKETDHLYYRWDSETMGTISEENGLFPTLIYYTGDRTENTVSDADAQMIENRLANGGSVFITGQNISDDNAETSFLEEVLHCRHVVDDMARGQVSGSENDEIFHDFDMLIFGAHGAGNQFSESGVLPLDNAVTAAVYTNIPDTAAAIRWEEDSGARGVFFAFGFEAISGMGSTNNRNEVLTAVLDWLGTPVQGLTGTHPYIQPELHILTAYPNPTNGAVRFMLNTELHQPWQLMIFDQTGRQIRRLNNQTGRYGIWDALDCNGRSVPSGVYYLMVKANGNTSVNAVSNVLLVK